MNPKKVILLVGAPGVGKTTFWKQNLPAAKVVSPDPYLEGFIKLATNSSRDPEETRKIRQAHEKCQRAFLKALKDRNSTIVVDNTNIRARDRKFYMESAKAFGYTIELVVFPCDPEACASRNIHGVGLDTIKRLAFQQKMRPGIYIYNETDRTELPFPGPYGLTAEHQV